MKKIFVILLSIALICAFLTVSAFASTESDAAPTDTPEISTESSEQASGGELKPPEEETGESGEKFYSAWIDKITDSTLWINVGAVLSGILAVIAFLKSNLTNIRTTLGSVASGQLSAAAVAEIIADNVKEAMNVYRTESAEMRKKLEEQSAKEDKLYAMFSIFMANAKINPYAKAEILKILSGTGEALESIEEVVNSAQEAIAAAQEAEETVATPALDAVLASEGSVPGSDYMELG